VSHAEKFKFLGPEALVLLTEVDDPQRFGVADFDEAGRVKRLVETPKVPPSNFALAEVCLLDIVGACKSIKRFRWGSYRPTWIPRYLMWVSAFLLISTTNERE